MLNSYQFDIVTATETWLQDTEYRRDYVQVNYVDITQYSKTELEKQVV